jgi:hypothetical protein
MATQAPTRQANIRPRTQGRLSDEVSDNRHGQRRTSADIHGRSAAGHNVAALVSHAATWLRDEEANTSEPRVADESLAELP